MYTLDLRCNAANLISARLTRAPCKGGDRAAIDQQTRGAPPCRCHSFTASATVNTAWQPGASCRTHKHPSPAWQGLAGAAQARRQVASWRAARQQPAPSRSRRPPGRARCARTAGRRRCRRWRPTASTRASRRPPRWPAATAAPRAAQAAAAPMISHPSSTLPHAKACLLEGARQDPAQNTLL